MRLPPTIGLAGDVAAAVTDQHRSVRQHRFHAGEVALRAGFGEAPHQLLVGLARRRALRVFLARLHLACKLPTS